MGTGVKHDELDAQRERRRPPVHRRRRPEVRHLDATLIVSACDGTTAQKWNAPAENVEAKVGNYLEETG